MLISENDRPSCLLEHSIIEYQSAQSVATLKASGEILHGSSLY